MRRTFGRNSVHASAVCAPQRGAAASIAAHACRGPIRAVKRSRSRFDLHARIEFDMRTQPHAPPPRAAVPTARSVVQVLVIERDAALRSARASALQRDGYAVTAAGTGAEAAAALDRQTFDVLSAAGIPDVVGVAPAFRAAVGLALRAADTPSPVCVLGESGTGKELLARLIHATSARAEGPFVVANCTATADARLDADLFGYRH
ncbi:MAG TPA: sigma 54-interacting transcriptional regulator, partial [Gemmatimonadaceae bacterium]|nr:sigma 54-interacting transcriptional regulator [Gemmatimonadaceae bacterium]